MTPKRIQGIILALACLIPFIRLGMGEIQPWDESLYVIRAQACLQFDAWFDQTRYAVGNLYSATHPPLGVWLIAISRELFGNSTFAIRFPVALASAGSVFFVWLLVRRLASPGAALVSAVSLAASDLFLTFSHWAQMEGFILFFGAGTIYFFLRGIERGSVGFTLASGAMLGLGLLTKFGFALFAVPILLFIPWAYGKPKAIWHATITIALALVIAVPWFIFMTARHADYWQHVSGSLRTLTEGHYAPSRLAWWYYLNRLFVALPLIAVALFFRKTNRIFFAVLVWLAVLFAALQIVGTRMPHFATILLIPGAMLLGMCWDPVWEPTSRKKRQPLIALLILAIAWSASEQVRLLVTNRLSWNEFIVPPLGVAIYSIGAVAALFFWFQKREPARRAFAFSILLLGIAYAHLCTEEERVAVNGASSTAAMLASLPQKNSLLVIHSDYPNEHYAPQLAYYIDGWTLGWIPGKTSRTVTWENAATGSLDVDTSREVAIVVRFQDRFAQVSSRQTATWDSLMASLRKTFSHERDFRSYFVFY